MAAYAFLGLILLGHPSIGFADCTAEDSVCMLHKSISVILKPPGPPSDKGLTEWDKNYITDTQSGPFYDGSKAKTTKKVESKAAIDKSAITSGLVAGLAMTACLVFVLLCCIISRSAALDKMSWNMWSQAIAASYAYLLLVALKDATAYFLKSWANTSYTILNGAIMLLLVLVVFHALLFSLRSLPMTLMGVGAIGLCLATFAFIDIFEMLEHLKIFTEADFFGCAGIFVAAVVIIIAIVALSTSHRELIDWSVRNNEQTRTLFKYCCCCCFDVESANTPAWNEWKKQATRCEDQLASLTIGYIFSQAIEYSILRAQPSHSISFNFHVLLVATAGLTMIAICFAVLTRGGSEGGISNRFNSAALSIFLSAAAWCLFHAAQWQYNGGYLAKELNLVPKSVTTSLLIALSVTLAVMIVFVISSLYSLYNHASLWDETLRRNFQALAVVLGFILGVAWVTCLVDALPQLAAPFPKTAIAPTVPAAVLASVLVLPIWGVLVLPRTILSKA